MSTTKLIPSRPLLRYLSERICNTSARPFCQQVTQPSTNLLRRSILLRPPQQCRHIRLARIANKSWKGRLQADNHKILDYDKVPIFEESSYDSTRIILWREAEVRPLSKPHVFIGVMSIKDVMSKYLGDRENAILDPGVGTSWMLVPRTGFVATGRGDRNSLKKIDAHLDEIDATNLHEYLLVKRKSWMVPKPGKSINFKGGRGGAKLINLDKAVEGATLSVMLAKTWFFLEKTSACAEFHIHFSSRKRCSEDEMFKELMMMPGGLALHPNVIQRQLPEYSSISIKPMSNGRELVWVVGKQGPQNKWVSLAKETMAEFEGTDQFVMKKGREMTKDRKSRLWQDRKEIASLKKEGKSFEHVLERQKQIEMREENLKNMFKERNFARRQKVKDKKERRKQERLRYQARGRAMLGDRLSRQRIMRTRWERRKEDLKVVQREQEQRGAMTKEFVARRNARRAEQKARSMSSAVDYYTKSRQTGVRSVEPRGPGRSGRRVRLINFKETARDIVKRSLLLRSSRPIVPTISTIERQKSLSLEQKALSLKRRILLKEQRRKRASPIRAKFEDMI